MKDKIWRWAKELAIFAVVLFAILAWQERNLLDTDGSVVIPQQNLVSLDGEVTPLLSTEKPNLVYFFAPWCSVCRYSINNLETLADEDVNIVRIALDYESTEAVDKFVTDVGVDGVVLLGIEALKDQFNVQGYPTYYLIDESGVVKASSMGYSSSVGLALRHRFNTDL